MNKFTIVLTGVLLLEGGLFYTARGLEKVPENRALAFFPLEIQNWTTVHESKVEKDVQEILKADDSLNRVYASKAHPEGVSMFMAYFKSQRAGQAPHSPKNCLPGSGWEPMQEGVIDVNVPGEPRPITINRYIVAQGATARVVLYWYQSRRRVVASEYSAKFWLVADSIRYHRSDTALVRVEAPMVGTDDASATKSAVEFVQAMFPLLIGYLPS
jgi:EpsI family protein